MVIKVILAIIIPPIAAYMQVGATKHLWISIILSLCLWVPGQIHALWLVLTNQSGK